MRHVSLARGARRLGRAQGSGGNGVAFPVWR
jgi:hypothetical protein